MKKVKSNADKYSGSNGNKIDSKSALNNVKGNLKGAVKNVQENVKGHVDNIKGHVDNIKNEAEQHLNSITDLGIFLQTEEYANAMNATMVKKPEDGEDIICENPTCECEECCELTKIAHSPSPSSSGPILTPTPSSADGSTETSCYEEAEKWQTCCRSSCKPGDSHHKKLDFLSTLLHHGFLKYLLRNNRKEEQQCPIEENPDHKCGKIIEDEDRLKIPCTNGTCTFDQCCTQEPNVPSCYNEIEKWQVCCRSECSHDQIHNQIKDFPIILHRGTKQCDASENPEETCGRVNVDMAEDEMMQPCKDGKCTFDQCCIPWKPPPTTTTPPPGTCSEKKTYWAKTCRAGIFNRSSSSIIFPHL